MRGSRGELDRCERGAGLKRAVIWTLGIIAAVIVGWLLLHVFLSPVNPKQEAPAEHVSAPCWTCHIVSESAKIREPE